LWTELDFADRLALEQGLINDEQIDAALYRSRRRLILRRIAVADTERLFGLEVFSQVEPVAIPREAYTSQAYAEAEAEKLWGKVWQVACRAEEIPSVGDYITYDIMDESIIVVRAAPDEIKAYYNVCQHRGTRLTTGDGNVKQFMCKFHGWRWDVHGENTYCRNKEDWGGALNADNIKLKTVKAESWGGWVWINMDPDSESLETFLKPAGDMLDPFQLERMRYRWRQWITLPCNWKTALEAFNESHHVNTTHPGLVQWGEMHRWWSKASGKHGWHGPAEMDAPGRGGAANRRDGAAPAEGDRRDSRKVVPAYLHELMNTVNGSTTQTFIKAAERLVDELPAGTPEDKVLEHLTMSAMRDDEARGVIWPQLSAEYMDEVGIDWHLFPNLILLPGVTFCLCYRSRPNGSNPDSCIFEIYVVERYPEGEEPKTEWVNVPDPSSEEWPLVLRQDFINMPEVQRGMKSRGFQGARPNPLQEIAVIQFHRILAQYMGTGAPEPLWMKP
jgi:nitrite reductase/ring-hydroxylating ferredoxin subunit